MPALTRDESIARAALLQVHAYDIGLDLTTAPDASATTFGSRTRARFTCRADGSTFLDVAAAELESAELDGTALDPEAWSQGRVALELSAGDHELVVRARMAYSHDGEGLHRYVDPADGQTYLYATSFLDAAPRMFACFDQPDLKATFSTTVTAPAGWTVLGNARAEEVSAGRWVLATTPQLSTYLWAVVVGPYASVLAEHDGIRLGVHATASLREHLEREAPELFEVTGQAFDAYHEMFGIRYPFGDYHQAFVPEFNAGAMENPGCVTFRDSMVFRSAVTDAERAQRARTVVHELAHMWFGDLVTMRWWDDLWLNESFAEYMALRVTAEVTAFQDSWVDFAFVRKPWGLAADQRTSTHPVAGNGAADSHAALDDFDGISYAKGAAVLQQLAGHLGDDIFVAGVRRHLAEHAYGNATLEDLLGAWKACGAVGLDDWADAWLRSAGPDVLHWEDGYLIRTPPPGSVVRRPHRFELLAVEPGGGGTTESVRVDADRTPVVSAPRRRGALLVDAGGQTWAKTRIDAGTLAALPDVLPRLADPVTRASVWLAVCDGAEDGHVPPALALDLLEAALPVEDRDVAVAQLTAWAEERLLGRLLPETRVARARVTDALLTRLATARPGSALQLATATGLAALTHDGVILARWLDGDTPPGLVLDDDLGWKVVRQLARLGTIGADDVAEHAARDRSAQGAVEAARTLASLPSEQVKADVWDRLVHDRNASNYDVYAWCEGFWHAEQTALTAPFARRFFTDLPATAAFRTGQVAGLSALLGFPRYHVGDETLALAEGALARTDLVPGTRRSLQDCTDDLRRALAVRS